MTPNDPFASFRINKPQEPIFQESVPLQIEKGQDPFASYRLQNKEQNEQEDWPQYLKRNAIRLGSRVVETIGGIPGEVEEIGNLIQSGTFDFLEQTLGKSKLPKEKVTKRIAPTSQELKEKSVELSKGYTSPKDESEKLADEFTTTVSSLLGPMKFRKALGVAALGTAARKGTETLGLEKGFQESAKLGTMIISSMINPKGVKQLYTNLYNEAENLVPKGVTVNAKNLENKLNSLQDALQEGLEAPSEETVFNYIKKLRDKIKDGRIDVKQAMASNRSLNEEIGDPKQLERAEKLLTELKKGLNQSIESFDNPEFQKAWKGANEAFSGVKESQKISRFIQKNLGNKPLSAAIITGLAETATGHPEYVIPTISGSILAMGGIKGIELMQRIFSNKTLFKYYQDVIMNSAKQNTRATISSYNELDNALNRQNQKPKP